MFDGLGKSKFYTKCKSAIKLMKTRVEMVKKKRNAMQKYLRNDILDLLRNGLDINAYGRAEGLLVEMNLSTCYDFVEQFCQHISNNLAVMGKQRECPEDCREAVSSLMFAAARIADLPELRELRTIFAERYGNSLDCFVNQEFVEKLKSMSPTKDMKLQVMQDIAAEADIYYNPRATEKKLYNPPAFKQNVRNDEDKSARRNEHFEPDEYKPHHLSHNPGERTPFRDVQLDNTFGNGQHIGPDTTRNVPQEGFDDRKAFCYSSIPPPYTKSKVGNTRNQDERLEPPGSEGFAERNDKQYPDDSVSESKRKPKSVRRQRLKPESGNDGNDQHDEEERTMDRLLMHYSQKKSPHGTGNSESVFNPPPQQATINYDRTARRQSWDAPPSSLLVGSSSPSETKKGHARASSLQPEMLNPTGHVHPKLPDYDDFVARLSALRGGN